MHSAARRLCLSLSLSVCLASAVAVRANAETSSPARGAFILNEYDIRDPAAFKVLATEVRESLKAFKGEFVLREKVDSLFGGAPSNLSVISFPTIADARAWLASPAFSKLKADREKAAAIRAYLVEKLD